MHPLDGVILPEHRAVGKLSVTQGLNRKLPQNQLLPTGISQPSIYSFYLTPTPFGPVPHPTQP